MRNARGARRAGGATAVLIAAGCPLSADETVGSPAPMLEISEQQTDGSALLIAQVRVFRHGWVAVDKIIRARETARTEIVGRSGNS